MHTGSNLYFEGGNVGIGTGSPEGNFQLNGEEQRLIFSTGTSQQEKSARIEFWENHDGIESSLNAHFAIQYDGLNDQLRFKGKKDNDNLDYDLMSIRRNGNVGIGTTSPDEKLTVKGSIHSEEVKVDLNVPGPDYVFEADYDLRPLGEIAAYIKANKHLPEVPPAAEMEANGIELGEMNMLLLKKIEELTLHMIALKEENTTVKSENSALKQTIHNIISRVEELERE